MAQKTIKITSFPLGTTEDNVRNALSNVKISKLYLNKIEAFVELQDVEDLDILEFSAPEGKLDLLEGATFQKVSDSFTWPSNNPVQELNYHQHDKIEQAAINLTDPNKDHLITISGCDSEILNKLSEEQIKSTVFAHLNSINRILKKPNSLIIELQDIAQMQKLEGIFSELKVPALGSSAYINLEAADVPHFSSEWISQHHRESGDIKDDGNPKHCLHQAIIPKLNKLTSMEIDFLNSQSPTGKIESQHNQIVEQSEQQIQTQGELTDDPSSFVVNEETNQLVQQNNEQKELSMRKEQQKQTQLRKQKLQKYKLQQQHNQTTHQQKITKQNSAHFIMGTHADRLLGPQAKTPTLFWAIILISVLVALVI